MEKQPDNPINLQKTVLKIHAHAIKIIQTNYYNTKSNSHHIIPGS